MFSTLVLVLQVITFAYGAIPSFGRCPNVRGISNFDKSQYSGTWYEYANVFEIYDIGAECIRATYTDDGATIGVFNEALNTITGSYQSVRGSARFASDDGTGELIVELRGSNGGSQPNYKVVDTDYTSYAIVYNCYEKFFIGKKESLWLLTRDQAPSADLVAGARNKMKQLGLPVPHLRTTPQKNCSELPPLK